MNGVVLESARQVWPAFVLVVGLLLVGALVERDGVFAAVGTRLERIRGGAVVLLAVLLGLEAVVTALLNLDTAAVFVTPIMIHAARARGCDERAFVYGALFMANGASILLPGSNLTNLIVLGHESVSGAWMARAMILPWLAVVALTIGVLAVVFRPVGERGDLEPRMPLRVGVGVAAALIATVLILVLHNPALPVLVVGVTASLVKRVRVHIGWRVLTALFVVAVGLGALARIWHYPAHVLADAGGIVTAAVAAVVSVLVNNLPAAALLSAQRPPHPLPLLIGLDLGPNLVFTGSLSAYLWYRAARTTGATPSLWTATRLGACIAILTGFAALTVLALVDPSAV